MFYSNYDTSSYDFVSFTNSAKLIKEKNYHRLLMMECSRFNPIKS